MFVCIVICLHYYVRNRYIYVQCFGRGRKIEEEQLEQTEQNDLTPAEKRAARKLAKQAARKAAKKDIRQAGFGTVSPNDSENDYEHSISTLADDPRFKRVFKDVDIVTQAQYSSMWSAAQGCPNGVMDIECPSVHRKLHAEVFFYWNH